MRKIGDAPVVLAWFGDVVQRSVHGAVIPFVEITCSRLHGDPPAIVSVKEPILVSVPMACLRLLRLGDIWQDGRCVGSIPLCREIFMDVVVSEDSSSVLPAGLPTVDADGFARFELPFNIFDAHKQHTASFLVKVVLPSGVVLIVPSMEIIRFYFGASGTLLSRIFGGTLAGENLYTRRFINPDSGSATLTLADGLSSQEAAITVARIAFDCAASSQFRSIVNSGTRAAANRQKWYPRAGFPLRGITHLAAEGVWTEQGGVRSFVVHRLLSCAYPFPFKSLSFTLQGAGAQPSRQLRPVDIGEGSPRPSRTVKLDSRAPTSRQLAPVELVVPDDGDPPNFPDLVPKTIRKVGTESPQRSRSTRIDEFDSGDLHLGLVGNAETGLRIGEVTSPMVGRAATFHPPDSLRKFIASQTFLAEGDFVTCRAPFGPGKVGLSMVRLRNASDGAYWSTCVAFKRDAVVFAKALLIAAGPGSAQDDTEIMLFDITTGPPLTESDFHAMARLFWEPVQARTKRMMRDVFIGAMTTSQLREEGAKAAWELLLNHVLLKAKRERQL